MVLFTVKLLLTSSQYGASKYTQVTVVFRGFYIAETSCLMCLQITCKYDLRGFQ